MYFICDQKVPMDRYPYLNFANGKTKKNKMICQKPQRINSDTV